MLLKQSTSRNLSVFMTDLSDHITGKTGLTLTITASKDGAAFASITPTVTELADGWYSLALTTTHTNTLGDLAIHITATGADPTDLVRQVVADLPGATVSSVTGAVGSVTGNVGGNVAGSVGSVTARVTANTDQLAGQTVTAAAGVTFPTSVASPTNITAGTITTVTNLTNAPTSGDFTATMKTSIGTAVAASAVASVTGNVGGNVTGSVGSVATGGITSASFAAGAINAAAIATDAIDADALKADAVTEIQSGLATASALSTLDGKVDTIDTNVDSVLADTNELQTDWVDGGRLDLILDARSSQSSVDDLPTNAELATALASADDAVLAAVATVDGNVDAIKVTTDKLDDTLEDDAGTFRFTTNALEQAPTGGSAPTAADIADAVWEEAIADHSGTTGSTAEALNAAGAAGDPWTTVLPGSYGAGSAGKIIGDNINATISSRATQTSVDDLPTNAELATALGTADDAVLAAIAGLNDLSAAEVNAEVDTAISDAALATAANLATVDTVVDAIKAKTDSLTFTTANRVDSQVFGMQSGTVTATAIATDAIDSDAIAASAVTEIQSGLSTLTAAGVRTAVGLASANLDTQLAALPTADEITDAVLDEPTSGHQTAGTVGKAITDAQSAGDPWASELETGYTASRMLRAAAALAAGKTEIIDLGGGAATVVLRSIGDSVDMVEATMDGSERTAVTVAP